MKDEGFCIGVPDLLQAINNRFKPQQKCISCGL